MNKFIKCSLISLVLVLLDQLSKTYLISYLKTKPQFILNITPFLDLVYAWNYGISFGLFREYYQYSNYVLIVLNSLITIYLINFSLGIKSKLSTWGLNLIIGGAIGNLIDRLIRGAVFDFIYFNYNEFEFPAFNLADCFITVGAALFIWDYLLQKKSLAEK
jgi:signal peptidase II